MSHLPAIEKILAAYRSTDAHITETEIQAAWKEHQEASDRIRWVEAYGEPEEWVKRAQQAHSRAEDLAEGAPAKAAKATAEAIFDLSLHYDIPSADEVAELAAAQVLRELS